MHTSTVVGENVKFHVKILFSSIFCVVGGKNISVKKRGEF